jgi:hypothetical protein
MSCTSTRRVDARLEAVNAVWGKTACRSILFVADVADSLTDEFITLQGVDPQGVVITYTIGKGTDPVVAGTTFVAVTFSTGATAIEVAAAFETALEGITGSPFKVTGTTAERHIVNRFIGVVAGESIGTSGFTLESFRAGVRVEIGASDGGINFTAEVNALDVTSNQTGGLIVAQIFQGSSASVSGSFLEINKEKFDILVGEVTGDSLTPVSGTKVTGFGESRLFQALDELSGTLILHPIRNADTNYADDVVLWNCAPLVSSTVFDGTALQTYAIEFNAYLDTSKNTKINLYCRGDWTQVGLDA